MYYTVIKHSSHLRTLEKCRKHSPAARAFHISLVFSNACRVLSQCNTRLRLLYLLNKIYSYKKKECIESCVTGKKNFTRALFPRCLFTITINGLSERGNTQSNSDSALCERQKRFVGRRCLESPSLLCFMNRLTG